MSAMSSRSCSERAGSLALGGNRISDGTKDDDDSDAFGCAIVGLACLFRVKWQGVERERESQGPVD